MYLGEQGEKIFPNESANLLIDQKRFCICYQFGNTEVSLYGGISVS